MVELWFFAILSVGQGHANVIGPFGDQFQCTAIRQQFKNRNEKVTSCWSNKPRIVLLPPPEPHQ